MGFLIDLAIRQRNDHNYMLCIIALSCFFSGTNGYGGGGWSSYAFLPCAWIGLLIFLRNEKKQCAKLWVDCKKCDRKKTTKRGLCGSRQKDRASHEVRMVGIFGSWGLPSVAARNLLTGLPESLGLI